MSQSTPFVAEIKSLIIETLRLEGVSPASIADDQPLFESGLGLDSVDALELVVAIERRYDITLQGADLERSTFATVLSLASFVESRISGSATPPHA